jgi:hypothetical protein
MQPQLLPARLTTARLRSTRCRLGRTLFTLTSLSSHLGVLWFIRQACLPGQSCQARRAQLSWPQLLFNNLSYFRSNARGPPRACVIAHLASKLRSSARGVHNSRYPIGNTHLEHHRRGSPALLDTDSRGVTLQSSDILFGGFYAGGDGGRRPPPTKISRAEGAITSLAVRVMASSWKL